MNNDMLQSIKQIDKDIGNTSSNTGVLATLAAQAFTTYNITQGATLTILSSVAGKFHGVINGMVSNPTLTFYDNASGASGTILLELDAGAMNGNYLPDLPTLNGISAWVTGGKAPLFVAIGK